jgi:predicted lipoprotein
VFDALISRRCLVGSLALSALSGVFGAGCKRARTRQEVLASLVEEVHAVDVQALLGASRSLAERTTKLAGSPGADTIHAAREAWRAAALPWKRVHVFRTGPIVDTNALLRASFWPARPAAVDAILKGTAPLDARVLDATGVDARGLFGLEHLLFDRETGAAAPARVAGESGSRARAYAALCASDLVKYAELVANALGKDGENYAAAFAEAGQQSVNRLVGHLVESVETLAENRFSLLMWMNRIGRVKPSDVEGFSSGSSKALALATFEAAEAIYYGGEGGFGLGALVEPLSPAVDEKIRAHFVAARGALLAVEGPLEHVVKSDPTKLEATHKALKALEVALKADLTSTLGVTLTFTSADGD